MKKIELIGEIGTNHNGNFETAVKLIEMAHDCSLDTIKFQVYDANDIVSPLVKTQLYGIKSIYEYWKDYINEKLITPKVWLPELTAYAKNLGLDVVATPHSIKNAECCLKAGIGRLKIASMDCNYYSFLKDLSSLKVPLLLSTGMSVREEIIKAVEIIQKAGVSLTLFHCTATYPTNYDEANLSFFDFLKTLQPEFLGLSDHSENNDLGIMSVVYGVDVIEKHITLDKRQQGPDHPFAMDAEDCRLWREKTDQAIISLGRIDKKLSLRERRNRDLYRRVPILIRDKRKGEVLRRDDFVFARPPQANVGYLQSDTVELFIGMRLMNDISCGEGITINLFRE